jgi:hypothetical protein
MKKFIATLLIPAALIPTAISILPPQAQAAPVQIMAEGGDVATIAQDFVNLLGQENYSSALGSYSSGSGVSSASLQQSWQDLVAMNGAFQGQVGAPLVGGAGGGSQVVVVTCQFEQGMRDVVVNFVDGQIIDFSVAES